MIFCPKQPTSPYPRSSAKMKMILGFRGGSADNSPLAKQRLSCNVKPNRIICSSLAVANQPSLDDSIVKY